MEVLSEIAQYNKIIFFISFVFSIIEAEQFIAIEIGNKFEYNNRLVYPLFILNANGQVNCLIEYEK